LTGWSIASLLIRGSRSSKLSVRGARIFRLRIGRRIVEVVTARLREVTVLVLQGPRSVGKSTVLHEIAEPPRQRKRR
jgi:ABC-type cobalamin/Fe3+-siderophores transport system ATPase subunit